MSEFSKEYWFRDWPNRDIPRVAAGVYAIWHGESLIYCGMSGREIEKRSSLSKKRYGLYNRLNSHASGRLSGDQFCVYVANRLVIPRLDHDKLGMFATGEVNLDQLTKDYIHSKFSYRYLVVDSSTEAFELEKQCKGGDIFGQQPYLNPA